MLATLLRLALRSLRSRLLTTGLTVFSIALSVTLLLGIDRLRAGAQQGFAGTISGVDLVVGARSGPLPLLLYAVFDLGDGANNISWDTYQHFAHHRAVLWTIPISLGDSHKGFRVVGTDENFYQHYQYRGGHPLAFSAGHAPAQLFDCTLGAAVARQLHYQLGTKIVLAHGLERVSLLNHASTPFTVTGILQPTQTPVDRAIYISLPAVEAMHVGWEGGTPPALGDTPQSPSTFTAAQLAPKDVSAFLLRTRSRISTLLLQREIDTYKPEPLTAAIPALTLAELWRMVSYADRALSLVSAATLLVGLLSMVAILYTTLNERRREMSILRALGLGARGVIGLLVLESGLIALTGTALGFGSAYALLFALRGPIEQNFGLPILLTRPSPLLLGYAAALVALGTLLGLVPAFRAYRNTLADGLSPR